MTTMVRNSELHLGSESAKTLVIPVSEAVGMGSSGSPLGKKILVREVGSCVLHRRPPFPLPITEASAFALGLVGVWAV